LKKEMIKNKIDYAEIKMEKFGDFIVEKFNSGICNRRGIARNLSSIGKYRNYVYQPKHLQEQCKGIRT